MNVFLFLFPATNNVSPEIASKKLKGQYLDKQYQNASALSCDKYFLLFVVRKEVLHKPCSLNFHQVK